MAVRRRSLVTAIAAVSIVTMLPVRHAVAAEETPQRLVRYEDDGLTVHVTDVPLSEVLEELGRQSGAEIRGQPREARTVRADFDRIPLAQALARLLPDQNFALVYGKSGHLERIRLIGGAGEPTATTVLARHVPAPTSGGPLGRLSELIDHHPPVPVDGILADAVGSSKATLRELVELSLHNDDEEVRAEAVRVGMGTLDGDAEFRSAVMDELGHIDSSVLTTLLRESGSEHAEEVAMQLLERGPSPEFKVKASAVAQRIRAGL